MRKQTKTMTLLMALLIASAFAMAQNNALSNATSQPFVEKEMCDKVYDPADFPAPRQGGNTIGEALVIPSLPYLTSGTTSGYTNNYDEACPWSSTSPDVVYAFTPAEDLIVNIDLCGSSYDTKLYVYENEHTPTSPIACNDDFYGFSNPCGSWVSALFSLYFTAGNTYYIVIDGFGGNSGAYALEITGTTPPSPPIGFNDCYDPFFWSTELPEPQHGGSVEFDSNVLTITGPNGDWCVGGAEVIASVTIPEDGQVSFNWSFVNFDDPGYDFFIVLQKINGIGDKLLEVTYTSSGSFSQYFEKGDILSLVVQSDDCVFGEGIATITNFSAPCSTPPIPLSNWALYLGILLMVTFVVIRFKRLI